MEWERRLPQLWYCFKGTILAKTKAALFADHSYKGISLPSQSAVEPVLVFSTHGRRSTMVGVVQGEDPAAMILVTRRSSLIYFTWILCRLKTKACFIAALCVKVITSLYQTGVRLRNVLSVSTTGTSIG